MLAGGPAATRFHPVVARMADAWAAMMDGALRPPRQGDTDEGRVLSLDPADRGRRAASLLAAAGALVGSAAWWPPAEPDVRSHLFAALSRGHGAEGEMQAARPLARPSHFPDAGVVILRDLKARADELWCRCDHGPHGYLSIAAHGHADALSIEFRHGGVDILADPGTYCYLTERDFRRYFRSTIGHNTLEIGGRDQARFGGPFLWLDAPESALVATTGLDGGPVASWTARHSGYQRQPGKPVHERMVTLDRRARRLAISDRIATTGRVAARLAFHLGPSVDAALTGSTAKLAWSSGGSQWLGRLGLPPSLAWRAYRGAWNPILGWYSPGFAEKLPATCLIGEGLLSAGTALETTLDIRPAA
jgi:hypothetical protein